MAPLDAERSTDRTDPGAVRPYQEWTPRILGDAKQRASPLQRHATFTLLELHSQERLRLDLHHGAIAQHDLSPFGALTFDDLSARSDREPTGSDDDESGDERHRQGPQPGPTALLGFAPALSGLRVLVLLELAQTNHAAVFVAGVKCFDFAPELEPLERIVNVGNME